MDEFPHMEQESPQVLVVKFSMFPSTSGGNTDFPVILVSWREHMLWEEGSNIFSCVTRGLQSIYKYIDSFAHMEQVSPQVLEASF